MSLSKFTHPSDKAKYLRVIEEFCTQCEKIPARRLKGQSMSDTLKEIALGKYGEEKSGENQIQEVQLQTALKMK